MRESQLLTPALVIDSGTTVSIDSCNFRGSSNFNTIGVVLRNANMVMKNSIVSGFQSGGMMLFAKPSNIIKIYKSHIRSNKFFGIQVLGNSQSPSIQYCNIENNHCVGLQICTASKATIRKNVISLNHAGIEVISSDPMIIENDISHNHRNGVMVNSIENLIAMPKICNNKIFSNNGHGVECIGMGNKSMISKNQISFNKKAGVQVASSATVSVFDNRIFDNIF